MRLKTADANFSETCEYTEQVCACAPHCQPLTSSTYAKLTLSLSVGMLPQETRKRQIAHPLFLVWSQRSPRSLGMPTLPAKSCLCDWNPLAQSLSGCIKIRTNTWQTQSYPGKWAWEYSWNKNDSSSSTPYIKWTFLSLSWHAHSAFQVVLVPRSLGRPTLPKGFRTYHRQRNIIIHNWYFENKR